MYYQVFFVLKSIKTNADTCAQPGWHVSIQSKTGAVQPEKKPDL